MLFAHCLWQYTTHTAWVFLIATSSNASASCLMVNLEIEPWIAPPSILCCACVTQSRDTQPMQFHNSQLSLNAMLWWRQQKYSDWVCPGRVVGSIPYRKHQARRSESNNSIITLSVVLDRSSLKEIDYSLTYTVNISAHESPLQWTDHPLSMVT